MNLNKRILAFLFFIIINIGVSFSTQDCNFLERSTENCLISNSGDVKLSIDTNDLINIENYDLYISNENLIKKEIPKSSDNKFNLNLNNVPGKYNVEISGNLIDGTFFNEEVGNLIIDLYQPMPPIIPLKLPKFFSVTLLDKNSKLLIYDQNNNLREDLISGKEDDKYLISLGNLNEITELFFYVKKQNELISSPSRRIYYPFENLDFSKQISQIDLDMDKIREVNNIMDGETTNEIISIYGTADNDGVVYVNGLKTQVYNNKFIAYVQLKKGDNKIEVLNINNSIKKEFNVKFKDNRFYIESFYTKKIISTPKINFEISSSSPENCLLYLNGNFIEKLTLDNVPRVFSIFQNIKKRNNLNILCPNNQRISETIFLDSKSPTITIENKENILNYLILKINEDIGFSLPSLKINIDNNRIDDYRFVSDYIYIDLSKLEEGPHKINVELEDYVGNKAILSDSFIIESKIPFSIKSSESSSFIGGKLYLSSIGESSDKIRLNLFKNSKIAFKHILINGLEVSDYQIKEDLIEVNLPTPELKKGEIKFQYVEELSSNPKIKEIIVDYELLDGIEGIENDYMYYNSYSGDALPIKFSGKLKEGSKIDKNSFFINGKKPIFFGDFFEIYLDPSNNNGYVSITLKNLVGDSYIYSNNKEFREDSSEGDLFTFLNNSIQFVALNGIDHNIIKFDSINYPFSILPDGGRIPINQLSGYRYTKMESKPVGSISKNSRSYLLSHDSNSPYLFKYLDSDDNTEKIIISDKTSETLITSTNTIISNCQINYSINSKCYIIDGQVSGEDQAGNQISMDINNLEVIEKLPYINYSKIYLNYVELNGDQVEISGTYALPGRMKSLRGNGDNCQFTEETFYCNIENSERINFNAEYVSDSGILMNYEEGFNMTDLVKRLPNIEITDLKNTFNIEDKYYFYGKKDIFSVMNISNATSFTIYVNNFPIKKVKVNSDGIKTEELEIERFLLKDDETELEIKARAENPGGETYSNRVSLIYQHFKAFLLDVFVN